ncbi:MAG: S41 family peptidase, partial [Deltaproteobacteria bacterium]
MKRLLVSFGAVSLSLAGGLLSGSTAVAVAQEHDGGAYRALDTLARAMTTIEARYVEAVDLTALSHAAIEGMAAHLDPHSVFLDPDEFAHLQERTSGRWFGIGVELVIDPRGARIQRVIAGGPADLAGVHRGDLLVGVDGHDLDGLDMDEITALLAGPRGEPVRLDLVPAGTEGAPARVEVVRDQVIEPAVESDELAPGVAYVHLDSFRERAAVELERDLRAFGEDRPLRAVVLDLRGNPGGLLEEAVGVVDLFVGSGTIVETRGRDGEQVEVHRAHDSDDDIDARLVVLVDGGSASASEIVAGALQDLGRATIVGSPTYGKGSVQQVYEFEDGSALKLTVARYQLPSGRTLSLHEGIQPDVVV